VAAQIGDITAAYIPDEEKEDEIRLTSIEYLLAVLSPAQGNVQEAPTNYQEKLINANRLEPGLEPFNYNKEESGRRPPIKPLLTRLLLHTQAYRKRQLRLLLQLQSWLSPTNS
jgi:hypothetical protein